MIKNYFFVILAAVTMLLVSCGNSQTTPQEIDGVEFTGNGLLGNFPYMMARYDSERANLERNLNGAGVLEKRNFAKENEFDIEKSQKNLMVRKCLLRLVQVVRQKKLKDLNSRLLNLWEVICLV